MPRKKSVRKAARDFQTAADEVSGFVEAASLGVSARHASWVYDAGVIMLYRDFERLMLEALVGAINNDTTTLSGRTGFDFPKHLTDEVCEYLITGGGYFDFRGREGLIRQVRQHVPPDHYLIEIVKKSSYRQSIERLAALRNFAAHGGSVAKKAALGATGNKRIGSAGSWLKVKNRFDRLVDRLKALAKEIELQAPY